MIQCKDLSYKTKDKLIIDHLNIDFDDDIVSIIGPNGSGKTTLLKLIEGINVPTSGEVFIDDKVYKENERKEIAKVITYLPQSRPIVELSGRILVEHGRFPYLGFSKTLSDKDNELINEAIKITKTEDLLDKKLTNMSGGERQKIYLALALCQDTKYILLDEPTTFLDITYQLELLDIIKNLKEKGKKIIVVLHDIVHAFYLSDKICVLNDGQLKFYGEKEELLKTDILKNVFNINISNDVDKNSLFPYKLKK